MSIFNSSEVITLCIFAGVSLFYLGIIQIRRARWKSMANSLGAKYIDHGIFGIGGITGVTNGRKFGIGTNLHRSYVAMSLDYNGIPLIMTGDFFKHFPIGDIYSPLPKVVKEFFSFM